MLITGATSGIGQAIARRADEAGHRLALIGRDPGRLAALRALVGDEHLVRQCDVRSFEGLRAVVDEAVATLGGLDVAVANAGVGAPRGFATGDTERWRELVETNVLGAAFTVRAVLAPLQRSPSGHLVLVGSVAGRRVPPGSVYAATKAAVGAMAEAVRLELRASGDDRTRVTLLELGWVDTPLLTGDRPGALPPDEAADAVMYALNRRAGLDLGGIVLRPTTQPD
jgi:NADP-dependent 3-hydroxy acid dehydrogenase YdfG